MSLILNNTNLGYQKSIFCLISFEKARQIVLHGLPNVWRNQSRQMFFDTVFPIIIYPNAGGILIKMTNG